MSGDGGPNIKSSPTRMVSSIVGCASTRSPTEKVNQQGHYSISFTLQSNMQRIDQNAQRNSTLPSEDKRPQPKSYELRYFYHLKPKKKKKEYAMIIMISIITIITKTSFPLEVSSPIYIRKRDIFPFLYSIV